MLDKNPAELELADLEKIYQAAESCDKRIFSEMRTNLQLVAGEHYVREGSRYWNRIRDTKQLTDEQKLRITKNHIQRITKVLINSVQSACPGVAAEAKDERDMHHQKSAEMHQSVIEDFNARSGLRRKINGWIKNFFEMGECAVKVFWEAEAGDIIGYGPKTQVDPETEEEVEVMDDFGQQVADETKPIYSGKINFETIPPFNLKRDESADSMDSSPFHIVDKMISKSALRAKLPEAEWKDVEKGTGHQYVVFDTNTGTYRNTKDQVLWKEIYFKPNPQLPEGYWYHWTTSKIHSQGKLPYGKYPIVIESCEEQTGNPRGISPIRHLRPVQVELNRAASTVAEHQITLGCDRLLIQQNTKLNQGALLPGMRPISYTGKEPTVLQGRVGDQFFPYLEMQVKEMYMIADMEELLQEPDAQVDIYTQLFRSMRFKRKFVVYSDRVESFLCQAIELALCITKHSAHPDAVVPMIGKSEVVNMAEFKSMDDLSHLIKLKPRSDDLETTFGKQITFNQILQYTGSQMKREDIGRMIRMAPFANNDQAYEDMTLDYDSMTNDILALDRGEYRPAMPAEDHEYALKRLTSRRKKSDYSLLGPQIDALYQKRMQEHEVLKAQQLQAIKEAEAQFIPSGGYLVKCDFYSNDPKDPASTKRVALPSESVAWLMQRLSTQGLALDELQNIPSEMANIGARLGQTPAMGGSPPPTSQPGPGGEASPGEMSHARPNHSGSERAGNDVLGTLGRHLGVN